MRATLVKVISTREGVGQNGEYLFVEFLASVDQYGNGKPDNIAFKCSKDVAKKVLTMAEGERFDLSFNLRTNEFKGKYYTEANVWKIGDAIGASTPAPQAQETPTTAPATKVTPTSVAPDDDLPF